MRDVASSLPPAASSPLADQSLSCPTLYKGTERYCTISLLGVQRGGCGFAILEAIGQFDNSACAIGAQDRLLQGLQGDPSGDAARQRALESILQVLLLLLAEKGSCDDCAQHLLGYLSVVMVLATRNHVPPLQAFMIGCTTRLRCATLMFYMLMSTFDGGLHSSVCTSCMRLTVAKPFEGIGSCAETQSASAGVRRGSVPDDGPAAAAVAPHAGRLSGRPARPHAQPGHPASLPAGAPATPTQLL